MNSTGRQYLWRGQWVAPEFVWTEFYEDFADKLLAFKDNRDKLVTEIYRIANDKKELPMSHLKKYPLNDICPFTTIGLFNRGIADNNRKAIARELVDFLGMSIPVPDTFNGIPVLSSMKSIIPFDQSEVPSLWNVFSNALSFSEHYDDPDIRGSFIDSYNIATQVPGVSWNLTMGLFWIRPRTFQTLDTKSRKYISETLGIPVSDNISSNAEAYLSLLGNLKEKLKEGGYAVDSFQEVSLAADSEKVEQVNICKPPCSPEPTDYTIGDILKDGCFIESNKLSEILNRLNSKKNLILQGPPGTGKTWLAKRLSYSLIGQKADDKVRSVQFHPNLSYEDFVRGYRPNSDGKLDLVNGPLMEMIDAASEAPSSKYVIVIEEINRGNPAHIFGEMLTLLEADKRTQDEALELTHRKHKGERVYIPENLYVIGTMNMADRSLAMVDFALRRRFAFVNMEPELKEPWLGWVHEQSGIDRDALLQIKNKLDSLNQTIADDPNLGPQFRIGHSFVTPNDKIDNAGDWFRQVVETEIGPLLDEYWYDDREKAQEERNRLLSGI